MDVKDQHLEELFGSTKEARCVICKNTSPVPEGGDLPEGWVHGPSGPLCEECSLYISGLFGDALP